MVSTPSSPSIRESLVNLSRLLDKPEMGRSHQWYDALNDHLEELEHALGGGGAEPDRADSLAEIRRAHPRLISMCGVFQRDGRTLLRRAALVVRLSARKYDPGKAPHEELRAATESLIDGVHRYLELEEELVSEVGQEIGGEG